MSASAPSGRRSRRRGAISTSPAAIRRKHASMASTAAPGSTSAIDIGLGEIERHELQVYEALGDGRRLVRSGNRRLPRPAAPRAARPDLRRRAGPGRRICGRAHGRVRRAARRDGRTLLARVGRSRGRDGAGERHRRSGSRPRAHRRPAWEEALAARTRTQRRRRRRPAAGLRTRAEARGGRSGTARDRVARSRRSRARGARRTSLRRDLPRRRRRGRRTGRGRIAPPPRTSFE